MPGNVEAILLAAGASSRMGRAKALLPVGGVPAVVRCVRALREGGVAGVIVVVAGPAAGSVAAAVAAEEATTVANPDPDSDMAGSARTGLAASSPAASAFLVCLADHPLVSPGTIDALLSAHDEDPGRIVIPVYGGRRGHPTLFPRRAAEELSFRPTLRDVVLADPSRLRLLPVEDEGVTVDMDTPEDYDRVRMMWDGAVRGRDVPSPGRGGPA